MKNILLTSAAFVLLAGSALAGEGPKVVVGGDIDFQAGWTDDDLTGQRDYSFRNDTEVSIGVHGKSDNGLGYGAEIDLEADVSSDVDGEGLNASQTYVYLDGSFGRFEMGSTEGAAEGLKVDASNIARATGGIAGDWHYFTTATGSFISEGALPGQHGSTSLYNDESFYNASKINYYSPRFSGFQLGLSFIPDFDDAGQLTTRFDTVGGAAGSIAGFGDTLELGVNYEGQWDNVGVAAAATYVTGDADTSAREDLNAWNVGTAVSFSGFSVAGSYGDWGDSTLASSDEGDYYTLGAAYDFGPFGASVTWLDSTLEVSGADSDFENLSIGADYSLAEGLTPYAELSFIEADAPGVASDNDATILILGTELAF